MNRQLAQILIGAAALTGAFFFGSVMQRRHGDLDKASSPQPMLENEDLVWHSAPDKRPSDAKEDADASSPALSIAESTAGQPSKPVTEVPGHFGLNEAAQSGALERKVVQPDFSRWSTPAGAPPTDAERPSPMLPLAAPPALLTGPARPPGTLTPQAHPTPDPLDALSAAQKLPEADPWTAPLSSVLLKPPSVDRSASPSAMPTPSAPALDAAQRQLPTEPPVQTRSAATELVPVNQASSRKAEVDTDSFRIHVARPGDTLQSLSLKYYGKPDFYLDIYLANQDQLASPIQLPTGKPLKIPDYGK